MKQYEVKANKSNKAESLVLNLCKTQIYFSSYVYSVIGTIDYYNISFSSNNCGILDFCLLIIYGYGNCNVRRSNLIASSHITQDSTTIFSFNILFHLKNCFF